MWMTASSGEGKGKNREDDSLVEIKQGKISDKFGQGLILDEQTRSSIPKRAGRKTKILGAGYGIWSWGHTYMGGGEKRNETKYPTTGPVGGCGGVRNGSCRERLLLKIENFTYTTCLLIMEALFLNTGRATMSCLYIPGGSCLLTRGGRGRGREEGDRGRWKGFRSHAGSGCQRCVVCIMVEYGVRLV